VFDLGGGSKDFLSAYIGDRIMVWLGGRIGERPGKLDFGCGSFWVRELEVFSKTI
jgi:hypothetical protein